MGEVRCTKIKGEGNPRGPYEINYNSITVSLILSLKLNLNILKPLYNAKLNLPGVLKT